LKNKKLMEIGDFTSELAKLTGASGVILGASSFDAFSSATIAATAATYATCKLILKKWKNVEPDPNKMDLAVILEACQKSSFKQKEIRKLWQKLIISSLDPEYPEMMTRAEIQLFDSLDSIEAMILYISCKYRAEIAKETAALDMTAQARNSRATDGPLGDWENYLVNIKSIQSWVNVEFGTFPQFSETDALAAIQSRCLEMSRSQLHREPYVFNINNLLYNGGFSKVPNQGMFLIGDDERQYIIHPYIFTMRPTLPASRLIKKFRLTEDIPKSVFGN